jgi:hypothetical protein
MTMTIKTKPFTGILSWMVIASLAALSTDMAWSESPQYSQNKKSVAKKSPVKKSKSTVKKSTSTIATTAISTQPAAKTAVTTTPLPSNEVAGAAQASSQPNTQATPAQAAPVLNQVPRAEAARPAAMQPQVQPQVSSNPYMTVQQPNPWQVQVYKGAPANVNPYLAYRYAVPATVPWNTAIIQAPLFTQPNWVNPFMAYQPPSFPPTNPWTLPTFQAPQVMPPTWVNPYLAYRQPVAPTTPWTPPAFQMPQFSAPVLPNPAQPVALTTLPTPWTPPAVQAPTPAPAPVWAGNPYLAHLRAPTPTPVPVVRAEPEKPAAVVQSPAPQITQSAPSTSGDRIAAPATTPWSTPSPAIAVKPADNAAPAKSLGQIWDSLKSTLLPSMPPSDQAILPTVKTVYPTGEKPLKVLTFKCPTELIGVTPLPTKALHELVNVAMDGINRADLLPFNMQQVCQ